ncbi:MAG: hypothetical protein Q9201_005353 [Fulgogasparrea decipioides]
MLQLHVWGPAFDLPSIDPQCLATIAYLSQAVPQGEWELVASSDPTYSPTGELPALLDNSIWVGGFQNITRHLHERFGGQRDLDLERSPQDRADISAYTSFLETHGQPLIDLSLYVSSENYHASTRPAYSHILQWPNTWLLPPQRRAAAKGRTDHLHFTSLDLDAPGGEGEAETPQFPAGTEVPRLMRSTQQTVSSLVKQPQHAARFRLEALAESFFEPLAQLLRGKYYMLSENRVTSLDCLALGYLSLALVPEVPSSWLSHLMKSRYPRLCHYVEDLARDCFGLVLRPGERASRDSNTITRLPWKEPDKPTCIAVIRTRSSLENLPYIGALYKPDPLQQTTTKSHEELSHIPIIPTVFVGFAASLAALGSYVLYTGDVPSFLYSTWPLYGRQQRQRLNEMGEAGAMLEGIDFRGSPF